MVKRKLNTLKQQKDFLPDYKTFAKTHKEKLAIKQAKKLWEKNMKTFHGDNWKQHNNYPFTLKNT